jgi:hypothetical protein
MHEYEVRICNTDGRAAIITAQVQISDHAAIRSARKLAQGPIRRRPRGLHPQIHLPPDGPGA